MGDIVSLVERAQETLEAEQAERMMKRFQKGQFNMNDLRAQLDQMMKMGGMSSVMGMMQEDFCILQPGSDGHHVLTGALLCFPASWTLSEKIGRGLPGIHQPVASYDPQVTRRVQRLFDAIRPDALAYAQPDLFHPRPEADQRPPFSPEPGGPQGYLRAERQVLMRLPVTRAVVFAIRTYVAPRESLSETEETAFRAWQESHRSGPGSGPQTGQSVSN